MLDSARPNLKNYKSSLFNLSFVLACLLLIAACEQQPPGPSVTPGAQDKSGSSDVVQPPVKAGAQIKVTRIEYDEVEEGTVPLVTRMLISDRYIRIDEDSGAGGYVLFDREKRRIFSVVDENESIVVVDPLYPLQAAPDDLLIRAEQKDLADVPEISGIKPKYYQFFANDTLCYHMVAADGLLPDVTAALRIYQSVLAAQQQESLSTTPKELQTPCYLANYIYAPEFYITKGFPIEQWDVTGYRRSLKAISEDVMVDKSLFTLPSEYQYFIIGGGNYNL